MQEIYVAGNKIDGDYESVAVPFLNGNQCFDCHGESAPAGEFSLVDLGPVDNENAAVWKTVWAQVTLREMPPQEEAQPAVVERLKFSDWIVQELNRVLKDSGGFGDPRDPAKPIFWITTCFLGRFLQT